MKKLLAAPALISALAIAAPANAVHVGEYQPAIERGLIKVHSRREVHDMLHAYGYDRVVFQWQHRGYNRKPNYVFRACQGRRAFLVDVDWYGRIVSQERVGRCYDDWTGEY